MELTRTEKQFYKVSRERVETVEQRIRMGGLGKSEVEFVLDGLCNSLCGLRHD